MAIVYISPSVAALSCLFQAGYTHLGPSEHRGHYIEVHTNARKWKYINGVVRQELITVIEELPVIFLLPNEEAVYEFVSHSYLERTYGKSVR